MAKASIYLTCKKCGEEFWHGKKCYNSSDARNYEDWAKENVDTCPKCWKADQDVKKLAEREKQSAENEKSATECPWTLPKLEGSEKQIKWANDIRNNLIAQMISSKAKFDALEAVTKGDIPEGMSEVTAQAIKEFYSDVHNKSSKWWIDNRGKCFFGETFEIGRGMR